ncbi:MAG TPA: hypothetical protein VFM37_13655 [Pseudonocardiaceae bacterium]|nr:hypothetical protein [Pseudonocardiaceae bacterium]
MSVLETVLIFVGVPAAVVAVVTGLVYASGSRRGRRYRPGRPFEFTPVWFLSSQAQASGVDHSAGEDRRAVTGTAERAALPARTPAGEDGPEPAVAAAPHGATGGASDRW